MVDFAAPLWLLGLATLPVIWWLHRLRASGPEVTVTALFLWRLATPPDGSGGRRAKPEPSWWLRALLMAALVLALASPQWLSRAPRVTVWVDDSLSMFTREAGATRIDRGIDQLIAALGARNADEALVHSLSSPGISLALTQEQTDRWPEQLGGWLRSPRGEPRPPAAAQMSRESEHWLVSDGASTGLAEWLQQAPVARVLALGQSQANAALTSLALRPALRARDILKGLVVVANAGPEPLQRHLVLRLPGQELLRKPLLLSPAGSETVEFELPIAGAGPLRAELLPPDALTLDDTLSVAVPTPVAVGLHGDCGRHLHTALSAHPYLRIEDATELQEATVVCASEPSPWRKPAVQFHGLGTARPVLDAPYWSRHAGELARIFLAPDWLRAYPAPTGHEQTLALLTAAETPLIYYRATEPPWIEVLVDMEAPSFSQRPEYLALVDGLLSKVLNRPLLETLSRAARAPAPSRIAPAALTASPTPVAGNGLATLDLGSFLVGLAGLLLLADVWRLRKRQGPRRA